MVSFVSAVGAMPPPVKRPTMGLKRDSSYLDTDDEAALSTTAKRLKVAFDDHVDVRIMHDWDEKSLELVKEEVRIAIQRHLAPGEQRDDTQYARLLQMLTQNAFCSEAPTTRLLKKYVMAVHSHIADLGECGKLVMAILDLSWLGRDDDFLNEYVKLLVLLASTRSKYIAPMMERLVSHFERLPASMGRLPGEAPTTRLIMFQRLHDLLGAITRRVPSASSVLLRMIKHQFPNDISTTKGYLQYQRHILQLAEAIPELKTEVMSLITQRLVNIDVQIQEDIEDLENDEEEKLLRRPLRDRTAAAGEEEEEEDDDDDSDDESVSESELTATDEEQRLRDLRTKIAKMDGTQDLLFEHYNSAFEVPSTPSQNLAYQELLSHFTNYIMPNRSRHAQFLLFHFSQKSPAYSEDFVNHFLRLTGDRNAPITLRLQACAYVASFTARASHMSSSLVRSAVSRLCRVMDDMRALYEPNAVGPDRKSYSVYYAIAQALLYVFCFRWRDLVVQSGDQSQVEEDMLDEGEDLRWLPGFKETMDRNMHSPLNPLKICSPAIVGEFAKISNHLRFLYIFTLLERNKRVRLGQASRYHRAAGAVAVEIGRRETAWDRKAGDTHHQLEAYFPFDPYHLPQSKRWIEGEFNEWTLPRGMKQDDDEDEEQEESEGEEEDAYESEEESIAGDFALEPLSSSASAIPVSR